MATKKSGESVAYQILDRMHDNFASASIAEAFNWDKFAAQTDLDGWYLVVFRSLRKPSADVDQLIELEENARLDAAEQPGFLFYFAGKLLPGATHIRNMSFCMWETRDMARAAAARSDHTKAIAITDSAYDEYKLERYNARIDRASVARVVFEAVV